jgi:hypothetical protein
LSIPRLAELPLWLTWVAFVGVLIASIELGCRTGLWRRGRDPEWEAASDVVSPAMFALLGLMLAFTDALQGQPFRSSQTGFVRVSQIGMGRLILEMETTLAE